MAAGVGSVLGGPLAAWLRVATGSWLPVFAVVITMDLATGLLALLVLKPMRTAWCGLAMPKETASPAQPGASGIRERLRALDRWAPTDPGHFCFNHLFPGRKP